MRNIQSHSGMLTAVRTEVLALRKFSVLNATAVIKAVKKRNKHLGRAVSKNFQSVDATQLLSQQYFFTSAKVAHLLTQAEIQSKVCPSNLMRGPPLFAWQLPLGFR